MTSTSALRAAQNSGIDTYNGPQNIRQVFIDMLLELWEHGEGFSGKRPGNWDSDWQWVIVAALVESGHIPGERDEWDQWQATDEDAAFQFVAEMIADLAKRPPPPEPSCVNHISSATGARVGEHYKQQFGDRSLVARMLKLTEEVGELTGAVVRHDQQRDGRSWMPEIEAELGDVMVVLLAIADKLELSLSGVTGNGVNNFLARTWDIGDK